MYPFNPKSVLILAFQFLLIGYSNVSNGQTFPAISNKFYRYDATNSASIIKDANNNITQLNDLSGNGVHLNQGTGVTYNPAGYIELTSGKTVYANVAIAQPYHYYLVTNVITFSGLTHIVKFIDDNHHGILQWGADDNSISIVAGQGGPSANKKGFYYKVGRWDLFSGCVNGVESKTTLNGLIHHNGNAGSEAITRIQLGQTTNTYVKELIVVAGALNATDDKAIRKYLLEKHSIADNSNYILGLGDSNTFPADSYLETAAQELKFGTFNRAIPGSQLGDAAGQFNNAAQHGIAPLAGWLTTMFGTNGAWYSGYKAEYKRYLENWIAAGFSPWKIILITPPVQAGQDAKLQAYRLDNISIALELGLHHFDAYTLTKNNGGETLLSDGTHLNAAGNKLMADELKKFLSSSVSLPLHLLSFSATKQNGKATLLWKTAQEQDISSFSIERSTNGRDFVSIGIIKSANISTAHGYSFTDPQSLEATTYYRIKILTKGEKQVYSHVISLKTNDNSSLQVFPNPAKYYINVQFKTNRDNDIQIHDISGKVVKTVTATGTGSVSTSIDVSNLTPGLYLVRVGSETVRFTKL